MSTDKNKVTGGLFIPPTVRHYFVDEAGDPVLFNAKGNKIAGVKDCSTYFMLGMIEVDDPAPIAKQLDDLRSTVIADPYFKAVPSCRPDQRKTALMFHAKDDCPEVRQMVFKCLLGLPLKFYAVIRDKRDVTRMVVEHQQKNPGYRYQQNSLYDQSIKRLFNERLAGADAIQACFATRGSADRTAAMKRAIEDVRDFYRATRENAKAIPIEVTACLSEKNACLQAADYLLWALQRAMVKGEFRYLDFVYEKVVTIHDVDDTRVIPVGNFYTQVVRLTADKIKAPPGI